jgi:hypothetical protein
MYIGFIYDTNDIYNRISVIFKSIVDVISFNVNMLPYLCCLM